MEIQNTPKPPLSSLHRRNSWREKGRRLLFAHVSFFLILGLSSLTALVNPTSLWLISKDNLADYPWIYMRNGKIPDAAAAVVLIAVGDTMLGRGMAGRTDIFDRSAYWLSSADLLIGNFEGVISFSNLDELEQSFDSNQGPYRLNAPPEAAALLQEAGFDLLVLANNHALDHGNRGLKETIARLHRMGIGTVGVGSTFSGAYRPLYCKLKGVKLAFLAFNTVSMPGNLGMKEQALQSYAVANWDDERVVRAIQTARNRAEVVIVSIHWGAEYDFHTSLWQQEKARLMMEAGASLVLGHHPHVIQKTQVLDGDIIRTAKNLCFVAYSLGNFVFDQYEERTSQGLALRVFLDREGLSAVQALPVWTTPRPRLMSPDEMGRVIEIIQPAARRIGFSCDYEGCLRVDVPQEAQQGIFQAGQIDLTGDGRPELVLRNEAEKRMVQGGQAHQAGGNVIIIQDGARAWQSPPDWQVLDLALGDPNDDGRFEMILALEKPDDDGMITNHPFIIGYRGGTYKDVWGGSAVADPIRELELGDLDGDGVQELVVLERRGNDTTQAVTIWRWNGWGFSLEWRSPESRYRDLVLLPGMNGKLIISIGEIW